MLGRKAWAGRRDRIWPWPSSANTSAAKGLGLHNDLQNEHSIVGNNPFILLFKAFATPAQYARDGAALLDGSMTVAFGLTEPNHGSDATFMETRAVRQDRDGQPGWLINGEKMWITGMHTATHCMVFARTSGEDGQAAGVTCFVVPSPLIKIEEWLWTFNMPTDHPRLSLTDVWVPDDAYWGEVDRGLGLGQSFVHQNRIRCRLPRPSARRFIASRKACDSWPRGAASPSASPCPTIRRSSGP